jgi:hypothetical protein
MPNLKEYYRALKKDFLGTGEIDSLTDLVRRAHWKLNGIRDRQKSAEESTYPLVDTRIHQMG